jgi:hypothetical protein
MATGEAECRGYEEQKEYSPAAQHLTHADLKLIYESPCFRVWLCPGAQKDL